MPTLFDAAGLPRPPRELAPGAVHLPGFLGAWQQSGLVTQAREIARSVAGTPVAMARPRTRTGQMSVHILSLGRHWATNPYRYVREFEGVPVPEIPANYQEIVDAVLVAAGERSAALAPWAGRMRAEVALVNYYPPGSRMGLHVDADEVADAPVVSLSIGDTALFRLGRAEERTGPFVDVPLISGDAVVFGGPARRAYHGITQVEDGTAPAHAGLKEGRINITIRQVDY